MSRERANREQFWACQDAVHAKKAIQFCSGIWCQFQLPTSKLMYWQAKTLSAGAQCWPLPLIGKVRYHWSEFFDHAGLKRQFAIIWLNQRCVHTSSPAEFRLSDQTEKSCKQWKDVKSRLRYEHWTRNFKYWVRIQVFSLLNGLHLLYICVFFFGHPCSEAHEDCLCTAMLICSLWSLIFCWSYFYLTLRSSLLLRRLYKSESWTNIKLWKHWANGAEINFRLASFALGKAGQSPESFFSRF